MIEKMKKTDRKYEGKIINLRVDEVEVENGQTAIREVCEHPGGVAILPIDENGDVTLVSQFRYPFDEIMLEIPAGKLEKNGEKVLEAGKRELLEETGLVALEYSSLGEMYPSVGFLNEVIYLYIAKGLTQKTPCPDEDEFVEIVKMPYEKLYQKVINNEVRDAKTIVAVLKAKDFM